MRRDALFAALLAVAGATHAGSLPDGITVVRGEFVPGQQPDGNSVVFAGDDGVLVVDTGRHPAHTQRVIEAARATRQPVVAVVNTHWHLDHVSGNPAVRAAFPSARVHASSAIESAMGGFLANYRRDLAAQVAQASDAKQRAAFEAEIARIDQGRALYPDALIAASKPMTAGGHDYELGYHARSVTDGDVTVFDPARRVLAAGDLVTLPAPFLDTACPENWRATLAALDEVPFETLVPGHGRPLSRAEFGTYRTAFGALLDCAASDASAAQCSAAWKATVDPLLDEASRAQVDALMAYYLGSVLRGDAKRFEAACGSDSREPDFGGRTVLDASRHETAWSDDLVAIDAVTLPQLDEIDPEACPDEPIGQVPWLGDDTNAARLEREALAGNSFARRQAQRLVLTPAEGKPLVFRNWNEPATDDAEGESRDYFYAGRFNTRGWHRVEVRYGHDAPGSYFVHEQSGAVVYAHNGGQVVAADAEKRGFVTFEELNGPHRLVLVALDDPTPAIALECRLSWRDGRAKTCGWTSPTKFAGRIADAHYALTPTLTGYVFFRSDESIAAECRMHALTATADAQKTSE